MREKSPGGKNFLAFGSLVYEIRENSEKNFSLKNFFFGGVAEKILVQ